MTIVGEHIYAMLITPTSARAVKLSTTSKQLDEQVDSLRDTISTIENGQRMTYPFDVALSHQIYDELFVPFAAELPTVKQLLFEPDGAMLRLPPNLLVMDQASVDAYAKRAAAGGDADFDFRGINWFGRDRDISTVVSPRSFAQLREGTRRYYRRDVAVAPEPVDPAEVELCVAARRGPFCVGINRALVHHQQVGLQEKHWAVRLEQQLLYPRQLARERREQFVVYLVGQRDVERIGHALAVLDR
jgi:hypothetical protein